MRHHFDCFCQVLLTVAVVTSLCNCGKSPPAHQRSKRESFTHQSTFNVATKSESRPVKDRGQSQIETSSWLDAAREDPDPRVRLHAIETWAIKPGKSLDPVTYALVDPDETVRARAQQLFEEALERRNQ